MSNSSTENRVRDRAKAAARRWMIGPPPPRYSVAHDIWTAKFETFVAGWMSGHRSARSSRRKRRG